MKNVIFIIFIAVISNCCTPANPLDNWAVGTSTRNPDELQAIADLGMTIIEVGWPGSTSRNYSLEETEIWAKEMKAKADKAGLTIWSIHVPFGGAYDLSKLDEEERQRAVALNRADIEMAARILKPKVYVIHGGAEPIADDKREAHIAQSRKSLKELASLAKSLNGVLALEVLPRTAYGNTSDELLRTIEGIDNVQICFDVNHLLKESHADFIKNTKGRILTTHICDYDFIDERHWLPGRGKIDWTALLKDLVAAGYPGPFMFEVTRGGDPPVSLEELAGCWKKLKEDASK